MDDSHYHAAEYQRQMQERGLGTVRFGWDGDQMAWECDYARQRTGVGSDGEPPEPLTNLPYYQCDHLGTPMELTDEDGNIAWEVNYKAWGKQSCF